VVRPVIWVTGMTQQAFITQVKNGWRGVVALVKLKQLCLREKADLGEKLPNGCPKKFTTRTITEGGGGFLEQRGVESRIQVASWGGTQY